MVCYQHPLDIVFVLDASSSVWAQNFTKAKAFVNSFIDPYEIGPSKVRVAFETYGQKVFLDQIIEFGEFDNKASLQQRIRDIKWEAGFRTETGMGLAYMRDHLFKKARPGVPHICIVITDGESQEPDKTAKEALGARQAGIDIFAIGVSESVNRQELNNIAGSPDRVIIVKTYGELEAIKDKLSGQTCKKIPTPAPTQAAEECGKDTPTDIYYVFDPASLGLDITGWVTQFITYTLEVREFKFMRMGVISGSCPIDSGFSLNTYSSNRKIRKHLARYDSSRLPALIGSVPGKFNQARSSGRKVAVIFIGGKVDAMAVIEQAEAAHAAGIDVFFAGHETADRNLLNALEEIGFGQRLFLNGYSARGQAAQFVEALCSK
ncbi:hypothetical protein LOTGIDRAFT_134694 [Lottia gigantea]|uniref:VWFA domain-containing protein n=1 Tax=Lottia gigantea TaxID=225164 RepID=V3ZEB6_LOTGI|nr:hypothetical protein LOTGIDRAFT_134694 [Lottia gigantea]ESO82397.1 hypothetical protein LOTGIDRAFT_134694 [Lottia gigantea]